MDKSKIGSRGSKGKSSSLGGELYALGSKVSSRDDKSKLFSVKGSCSAVNERKREGPCLGGSSKKPKTNLVVPLLPLSDDDCSTGGTLIVDTWEKIAIESDPMELVLALYSAIDEQDFKTVVGLLCGSVKLLGQPSSRSRTENLINLLLIYISKIRPILFCNDIITTALLSLLRRETSHTFKSKPSNCTYVVATNILFRGFTNKKEWPQSFLRVYLDDAVNERLWVDNELCAPFIMNICSTFRTRVPPKSFLQAELGFNIASSTSSSNTQQQHFNATTVAIDEDSRDQFAIHGPECAAITQMSFAGSCLKCDVQDRYTACCDVIEQYIVENIKETLNRRQSQDCYTKNFLKFLCSTSGIDEVRYLSTSRLEMWLHNGKLMKTAQELLSYICFNINSRSVKDREVLASLVKMRLKTKLLINFYMTCLKEVIVLNTSILPITLKLVLQNELSSLRNPNNMGMLATMFQICPEKSAKHLAEIYKECLLQREDCLRTLRVFLRELVRILRFDINIVEFCKSFLNGRPELTPQIQQSEYKERIFHSVVDIICLCMLLSVSPSVREALVSQRNGRDVKSNMALLHFYQQISQIQLDTVSWMYEIVPNIYSLQGSDFSQALHKILLLESPDQYSRSDQWPSEPERTTLLRMVSETPIYEDTLLRIILIGITHDIPFTISETFEVLVQVIKRASALRNAEVPVIHANKFEIIDFLFSMAEYHCPEKIKLPKDYSPPKLAISVLYWKAWTIMLMISAHNPSTFGAFCWNHYPTMKMLIEMCITNQFIDSNLTKEELQILSIEREQIVELEKHLAAQTSQTIITEENAILITQVMLMDPMGCARRIPSIVLDQLKHINKQLKLGHLLCRSRKPDLLLEIIQKQGTTQSMPWLSDLVQNSDGEFRHLPVQCLCEFLLSNADTLSEENSRDAKLLKYLRKLIEEKNSKKKIVCEVLDYIFRRLSSTVKQSRTAALSALKLLLKDCENWLLITLPNIPYFADICPFIIQHLCSACQVENEPDLVMIYIQFIAAHSQNDNVTVMVDYVMDMAQLIVERNTMFQHITPFVSDTPPLSPKFGAVQNNMRRQTLKCLFVMFNNYIIKLREHQEPYEWIHYPDLLMVQFDDGVQLPIHLNIIHAFVILLTHSSNTIPESMPILDYWFPAGRGVPHAFIPDLSNEHVQFLPDWLKLKMIRSPVQRLVEAAMYELTPDQIVLFVQNFGTPVSSMSKLLALLDHAVIEQFEDVKIAILNKAYLAQLIKIQHVRGAKNGHVTIQALELHSHSQTVPDQPKLQLDRIECVNLHSLGLKEHPINEIKADVENIICEVMKTTVLSTFYKDKFRKLIHQMLQHCELTPSCRKDCHLNLTKKVLPYVIYCAENSKTASTLKTFSEKKNVCILLRIFLKHMEIQHTCGSDFDSLNERIYNLKTFTLTLRTQSSRLLNVFFKKLLISCKLNDLKFLEPGVDTVEMEQILSLVYHQNCDRKVICSMIQKKSTKFLVENIIAYLQTCAKRVTKLTSEEKYSQKGLLVDWCVEVDPELITMNKTLQLCLMFSESFKDFRCYLLSLLCHETNWDTLNETINYLLQEFKPEFNESAILDFIEALMNNPRLWKGRDKTMSKKLKTDVLFILDKDRLEVLTLYILKEAKSRVLHKPLRYKEILRTRIELLIQISNKKNSFFLNCLEYVTNQPSSPPVTFKFLEQLYMMHPKIKFMKRGLNKIYLAKLENFNGFRSDKVTNYLITSLGNLFSRKDFETLSSDTELLMRKLAASHPSLFLRQLGVFCSQIQGKAHINIFTLRDEHYIHRFIQILRTFEVLKPIIFNDEYTQCLQKGLECYFTFFRHHFREKETYQIVIKFVALLQAYIKENPSCAFVFIEKNTVVLQNLAANFKYLLTLQQLVQGLSLLKHKSRISSGIVGEDIKQEHCLDETLDYKSITDSEAIDMGIISNIQQDIGSKVATSIAFSEIQKQSLQVSSHIFHLFQIIKRSDVEEIILGPLQEIESVTSKRFYFIHELFDRLLDLIFSTSAQVRSNAYILLIRHLKNQPGRSDIIRCTLNAFIQCLCSDNSSVASTAVDNLVEFVVLLQEHSIEILCVAFSLGIKSRASTSTHIKRAVQALMLQQGF